MKYEVVLIARKWFQLDYWYNLLMSILGLIQCQKLQTDIPTAKLSHNKLRKYLLQR